MPAWLAPVAGAVLGSVVGNLMNREENSKANDIQRDNAANNIALQKEFAQNSLQWKIKDAQKAGVSPLAALGAQGTSFQPVSVGYTPDTSLGDSMAQMGQNLGAAYASKQTADQRVYTQAMESAQLENAQLQNELLRSQITTINKTNVPPMPGGNLTPMIDGQGNSKLVIKKPAEITASSPGVVAQQAGSINDYGFVHTGSGGLAMVPSQDVKQRIEDQFIPEMQWSIRNNLNANTGAMTPPNPKDYPPPKGYDGWEWSWIHQEFRPYKKGKPEIGQAWPETFRKWRKN